LTTTPRDTPSAPATGRPPRIQLNTLVGMRGILMFTVFFGHCAIAYVFNHEISDAFITLDIGPAQACLSLFFMLSGFVLAWVARPGETKRAFWRRRAVKIFPNHVVTWVAGLVLMIAFGVFTSWWEVLPSLFLIQSWIPVEGVLAGTNGPAWSLSCELFMYAMFPVMLAWALRLDARRLWRWLVTLGAAIIVVTAIVGVTVPSEPKALGQDVSAYQFYVLIFFPLTRLLDFAIGVLVARLVITGQWKPVRARWTWLLFLVGWVISMNLPNPLGFVAPFVPALILGLGGAATADINESKNLFTRRWAMWLGDRSFAFYLVHGNVLIFSEKAFGSGPDPTPWAALFVLGVLVVSLTCAHLLHTRVENPMMKNFARARRRPAAGAAPAAATATAPAAAPAKPPVHSVESRASQG
jgi:peptidoglycan/LPS O-acetylase OafA/YrhL